ncbi:MAG: hypothetical protein E6R14_07710 [Thermomicrobiales bacterium]|nr:MAG: hypothetical protein E6R14_07710 [Thermomicrobiales bacterium]
MRPLIRALIVLAMMTTAVFPALAQTESETNGLVLEPVTMDLSAAEMMRLRPFVLPDHLSPAFEFDHMADTPFTEVDGRTALQRFLELRNVSEERIAVTLARFDDPAVVTVIPAPNLRAALLMLTDWDPYRVTIEAILDGKNESGHAFEAVDFRPLEFSAAIATLQVAYSTGAPRLLLSDRYRNETPQQLIPVLVHESMHDGIDNSFEEEIIAGLLDSLTYAEVLTIDPAAANTGTELAAYNNVQLFALMNSVGRRGAGYVGVATSFDGDAYVGPGLEAFDADSVRSGLASDAWYAQLQRGGSDGGSVLETLLGRFPASESLVSTRPFPEEAIAVIDQGIGLVLTPRKVRAIAVDLGLSLASGSATSPAPGDLAPSVDLIAARPFLPSDPRKFDLRWMHATLDPIDAEFARAALRESLIDADIDTAMIGEVVAQFDDRTVKTFVPDPGLRAGLLMLYRSPDWGPLLDSALTGENDRRAPVRIAFRDLPLAVPAVWESAGWAESPVVWVNSMLIGERPELLATAIAEGLLLESNEPCAAQAVIAAALSSILWADFVTADPSVADSATWGAITRNRDLFALLNSQPFDPGTPQSTEFGLRLAAGSYGDVLPGLPVSAGSFESYIVHSPRVSTSAAEHTSTSPPVLTTFLRRSGLEFSTLAGAKTIDDELLASLDLEFARLLPVDAGMNAAASLGLTISSANR